MREDNLYSDMQTFDTITSYLYGTSAGKVCKIELLEYLNIK